MLRLHNESSIRQPCTYLAVLAQSIFIFICFSTLLSRFSRDLDAMLILCVKARDTRHAGNGRAPTRYLKEREKMLFRLCMDFEIDSIQEMEPANSLVSRFEV